MSTVNYDELDPGIREVVKFLNDYGYRTTDSGDGVSKPDMECAMNVPNVVISTWACDLINDADSLQTLFKTVGVKVHPIGAGESLPTIQATYDPADYSALILLTGVDDKVLAAGLKRVGKS